MARNINNFKVMDNIIDTLNYNRLIQQREISEVGHAESSELEIKFNIFEESDGSYSIVCRIEDFGKYLNEFKIGYGYKERGADTKVRQLMRRIETSRELENAVGSSNKLKSWGYEWFRYSTVG